MYWDDTVVGDALPVCAFMSRSGHIYIHTRFSQSPGAYLTAPYVRPDLCSSVHEYVINIQASTRDEHHPWNLDEVGQYSLIMIRQCTRMAQLTSLALEMCRFTRLCITMNLRYSWYWPLMNNIPPTKVDRPGSNIPK